MNEILEDMHKISDFLSTHGYPLVPSIPLKSVSIEFSPREIRDLFNTQETNIRDIDKFVDWDNPYSAENVVWWVFFAGAIAEDVERWLNWKNHTFQILNGEIEKTQYLENQNREYIVDINGEKILTFEGYF